MALFGIYVFKGWSCATVTPGVPGGAATVINAGRVANAVENVASTATKGSNAAATGEKVVFRRGANDTKKLLETQAASAEKAIGIHGVSVSTSAAAKEGQVVRSATCCELEKAGFKVTQTGKDLNHHTVELPKPGVRFLSLGDSRSRCFRAFELMSLCGNWAEQVEVIQCSDDIKPGCRVLFPQNGRDNLLLLEKAVFNAEVIDQYIGIGSPNFEWLYVVHVTNKELIAIRQLASPQLRFDQVHRLLKTSRRNYNQSQGKRTDSVQAQD